MTGFVILRSGRDQDKTDYDGVLASLTVYTDLTSAIEAARALHHLALDQYEDPDWPAVGETTDEAWIITFPKSWHDEYEVLALSQVEIR